MNNDGKKKEDYASILVTKLFVVVAVVNDDNSKNIIILFGVWILCFAVYDRGGGEGWKAKLGVKIRD